MFSRNGVVDHRSRGWRCWPVHSRDHCRIVDYGGCLEVLMTESPGWHITGDWFDNCSCAVACPCTFAQAPDNGFCESVLFWHIRHGHYGDINLDGLSFVRVGRWEGDLWAGKAKGAAGLFIDEGADERQAEVLPRIFGGHAGGFPAVVAALFAEGRQVRGVERARTRIESGIVNPIAFAWWTESFINTTLSNLEDNSDRRRRM